MILPEPRKTVDMTCGSEDGVEEHMTKGNNENYEGHEGDTRLWKQQLRKRSWCLGQRVGLPFVYAQSPPARSRRRAYQVRPQVPAALFFFVERFACRHHMCEGTGHHQNQQHTKARRRMHTRSVEATEATCPHFFALFMLSHGDFNMPIVLMVERRQHKAARASHIDWGQRGQHMPTLPRQGQPLAYAELADARLRV